MGLIPSADPIVTFDLLPVLQFLRALLCEPTRGEQCPGRVVARQRARTRKQRPPQIWTNIDFEIDFLLIGELVEPKLKYIVGSVGRALMPGMYDDLTHWRTAVARVTQASRVGDPHGQVLYAIWRPAVEWAALRCSEAPKDAWRILRACCLDARVTDTAFVDAAREIIGLHVALRAEQNSWQFDV